MSEPNMREQSYGSPAGRSGRWFRRGRNIVIVLGNEPESEEQEFEAPTKTFLQRVINPRIDVDAQRALISMERDPGTRQAAHDVLSLIESERLLGIYRENQREPALLARRRGTVWWEQIRPGKFAAAFCDPARRDKGPMLVFRVNIGRDQLIDMLVAAAKRKAQLEDPNVCRK